MLPIAPFPPPTVCPAVPPAAYTAWSAALSLHLQLPRAQFTSTSLSDASLRAFLHTYLQAAPPSTLPAAADVKRKVLTTVHRILTLPAAAVPGAFADVPFLRGLARAFPRCGLLRRVLAEDPVWRRFEDGVLRHKRAVVAARAAGLVPLFRFLPRVAEVFLAGDEWVEVAEPRELAVALVLVAAGDGVRKPNWSLVSDTLYGLVAGAREPAFVKMLVETTAVVAALRRCARGTADEARVEAVLRALERFGRPRARRARAEKGKGKGKEKTVVGPSEEEEEEDEMAVMRRVADVRDIFPHLGSGFVRRCLDALGGDVERVTGALLEDSLPSGLRHADQSEEYIPPDTVPTPPPTHRRRNVFDNDALSTLSPAALARLHIGRKNTVPQDADRSTKASVLAALAAFDSGDDERDDTYDVADVGTGPYEDGEPERTDDDAVERVLWAALQSSPAAFARDGDTRRSVLRSTLREATGWSDEAIEGWRIMLEREPRRVGVLERRYGDPAGAQSVLERTAWDGDEEDGGAGRGRGRGGRARGGGRGRGRGAPEETPQRERARKEAGKGGRANHNRRDQRARKMARGGFPG